MVSVNGVKAQHYQFSQYYAASTYLNPAFTGANVCSRLSLLYRNQWLGVGSNFSTYQATIDHSLSKYKSGIGLQLFSDNAGPASLSTKKISVLYAYETKLSRKLVGRAGFNAGTVQRQIDYEKLIFADQIYNNNSTTSVESFGAQRLTYFDIGAGLLLFSKYFWAGLSVAHLNEPDQSLLAGNAALPREFKLHAGYKYLFNEEDVQETKAGNDALTFTFNYKHQASFNQLDIGIYYTHRIVQLGFWYRGIPFRRPEIYYRGNDALVSLFGISFEKYRFGYSFDLTISKLSNRRSKGSHELSIAYQMCNLKKVKKKKADLISCPKF